MSINVNENPETDNKTSVDDSTVMSKIACHYVSLPQVILKRIDDPSITSSNLNPEDNQTELSSTKGNIKQNTVKGSSKSKNTTIKSNLKKNSQRTNNRVSHLILGVGKKSSLKQPLTKSRPYKKLNYRSLLGISTAHTNITVEKKSKSKPRKVVKSKEKLPKVKSSPPVTGRTLVKKQSDIGKTGLETAKNILKQKNPAGSGKAGLKLKPNFAHKSVVESFQGRAASLNREMSIKDDEESILEELENTDSDKSFDGSSGLLYDELIQSLESTPKKGGMNSGIRKQALSKNIIKLSGPAQKVHGAVKSGIIRKNTIPIQAKSKPLMKPNKAMTSVNVKQIKKISSGNIILKQKMPISPIETVKQKQMILQSPKPKASLQIKQKAISVQSVESINSKAKKPEPLPQMVHKVVAAKQTATVTPLSKARKSFSSGPSKVIFSSKTTKERNSTGVGESEPVNLLSKLVGLPISPSKLQVMSLSHQNSVKASSPTSPPPLANIKNNESSKMQYVSPNTHEREVTNKNAEDLLKILGEESEAGTSQQVTDNISKNVNLNKSHGNEMQASIEICSSTDDKKVNEDKPRTIYDLMAEINLIYPSWNLHIMPDTNTFCIAQISRGRLGIPVLKKCIELDEVYNAKVYVHQYHCKRFDGQYDSEESIIALIHEINSLRA